MKPGAESDESGIEHDQIIAIHGLQIEWQWIGKGFQSILMIVTKYAKRIKRTFQRAFLPQALLMLGQAGEFSDLVANQFQGWSIIKHPHLSSIQQATTLSTSITQKHKIVNSIIIFNRVKLTSQQPHDFLQLNEQVESIVKQNLAAAHLATKVLWHAGTLLIEMPRIEGLAGGILSYQLGMMNAILGQRESLDINNGVLACELGNGDESVERGRLYKEWCEGRRLPFPGSVAQLRSGEGKQMYAQFI